MIFEVLSPSTASFDRGDKFTRYRLLDTLTDYVLIAVDRMSVEHHTRQQDGGWKLTHYHQPGHLHPPRQRRLRTALGGNLRARDVPRAPARPADLVVGAGNEATGTDGLVVGPADGVAGTDGVAVGPAASTI